MTRRFEPQPAVLADGRLLRHGVQLNILGGVAECAAASSAHGDVAIYLHDGDGVDKRLGVGAVRAVGILERAGGQAQGGREG